MFRRSFGHKEGWIFGVSTALNHVEYIYPFSYEVMTVVVFTKTHNIFKNSRTYFGRKSYIVVFQSRSTYTTVHFRCQLSKTFLTIA